LILLPVLSRFVERRATSMFIYREAWLCEGLKLIATSLFSPAGYIVPHNIRISVGFPLGRRGKRGGTHSIGQCWCSTASADNTFEIFICPTLQTASDVIAVLIHEAAHAVVGIKHGHRTAFKRCAISVGLTGPMTATRVSESLLPKLLPILKELGNYPHASLRPRHSDAPKKQRTRLLKIQCGHCGWTARASRAWVDVGLPTCVCGGDFQEECE
jgi:hypothetical protein